MLGLLALMAQTATLGADASRAGLACAQSVAVAGGENPIKLMSQVTNFMLQAAKADPAGKPFITRVTELTSQPLPEQNVDSARALLPECDRRFPLARANGPVRLPTDPFRRDVMCFGVLGIFKGAEEQMKQSGGDAATLAGIDTTFEALSNRLTDDALKAHGIESGDAFVAVMGDQLVASLALGSTASVARTCGISTL